MKLHKHFDVNEKGHLTIGGMDSVELAQKFGTPAYILDESVIRANCREYLNAARREFGEDALPLYASKALCFTGIYKLAAEENRLAREAFDAKYGPDFDEDEINDWEE